MEFDEILDRIGNWGRHQKLQCLILCLAAGLVSSYSHFAMPVMLFTPPFWCEVESNLSEAILQEELKNRTRFLFPQKVLNDEACQLSYDAEHQCSDRKLWHFDRSIIGKTAVTFYDLVCGRRWYIHIAFTLYTIGDFTAVVIIQVLADYIGRKNTFMLGLLLHLTGGTLSVLIPNLKAFLALRFINAVAGAVSFISLFIWGAEIVHPKQRATFSNATQAFFSLGTASLGFIGYICKDWVNFGLATTLPSLLFLPALMFLLVESPRWMIAKGKSKEAILAAISKMAKRNGTLTKETAEKTSLNWLVDECIQEQKIQPHQKVKFWHLLQHKNLRSKTLLMMLMYICINIAYPTSQFNAENLPGNPYMVYALAGIIEIPGALLNLFLVDRFGRIRVLASFTFLGGLLSISCAFFPYKEDPLMQISSFNQWMVIVLALISKVFFAASFITVMQVCTEHMPTSACGTGMGLCAFISRIAFMCMPLIRYTAEVWRSMPLVILGVLSLMSSISCLFLPETMGKPLPQTFADAVLIGSVSFETFLHNLGVKQQKRLIRIESQAVTLLTQVSVASNKELET